MKRKKIKHTSLITYQAHEHFKIFVEKLTTTEVIKKIDGQVEIEKEKGDRKREREKE